MPGTVTQRRAADWLSLGAAPTFAFMAAFTGILGSGMHGSWCSAGSPASPLNGMMLMYVLMSVFHCAPWWKLICDGRTAARVPRFTHESDATGETYG